MPTPQMEEEKKFLKKQVAPIRYYPLVYLVLEIAPVLNRLQNAADPTDPVFALYLMQSLSSPLVGFANAIVYAMNSGLRDAIKVSTFKRAVGARRKREFSVQEFNINDANDDGLLVTGDSDESGDNDLSD